MDKVQPGIRFVTRKWAPAIGGMETYSINLAAALERHETVELIALRGRSNGKPPRIVALLAWGLWTAVRLLAARPAPVTLLGDMAIWPLGWIAGLRGPSSRIVLAAHGTDVSLAWRKGLRAAAYRTYLQLGARLLTRASVLAVSGPIHAAAIKAGWRKVRIVPPGTTMHGDASNGSHDGSILFAGRLIALKGCGWFIREVLPLLPEGTRLVVAGTQIDPSETAALARPGVEYVGQLDQAQLAAAYRSAMCVIVPNVALASGAMEGFGLIAIEAAAAGGLVLASRSGGLIDAVDDGTTGLLLTPGDPAEWAQAIGSVAGWTVDRRQRFLNGSMARIANDFTWDRVARDVTGTD